MTSNPTEILSHFEELEPETRRFVQFLSLLYEPTQKKVALQQFDSYLDSVGNTSSNLEWSIKQAKKKGLLFSRSGRLACPSEVAEEFSTSAVKDGVASQMCKAIRNSQGRTPPSLVLQARLALYSGELEQFWKRMERTVTYRFYGLRELFSDQISEGVATEQPLNFFPDDLAREIAGLKLIECVEQALHPEPFLSWLRSHHTEEHDIDEFPLGTQILARNHRDTSIPTDSPFKGVCDILDGDLSALDDIYEWLTGEEGVVVEFPHALHEFVYIAGCHAQNSEEKVRERLRNGNEDLSSLAHWFRAVRWGKTDQVTAGIRREFESPDFSPLMQFFKACFLFWGGFRTELDTDELSRLAELFGRNGYSTIATQFDSLTRHLLGEPDALTPFLSLLQPVELWENKLAKLEQWASQHEPTQEVEPEEEQRVVWILDPERGRFTLEARVQKKSARGWSKGRSTRVAELAFLPDGVLTEQDSEILNMWALAERYGFNAKYRVKLLEALARNPLLFRPDGDPLRLSSAPPTLQVETVGEQVTIKVVPEPWGGESFGFLKVDEESYRFSVVPDTVKELLRDIGPSGLSLPTQASDRVRAVLGAATRAGLCVESSYSASSEVQFGKPDNRLKIRLYPRGDGLSGEVLVQPAGARGPAFAPGQGARYLLRYEKGSSTQVKRDLATEESLFEELRQKAPSLQGSAILLDNPRQCLELLEELQQLPAEQFLVQWPHGRTFQLAATVDWSQVQLRVSRQRDWFALRGELSLSEGQEMELSQLLELHRLQQTRFIALDNQRYLALSKAFERKLQALEQAAARTRDDTFLLHPLTGAVLLQDDKVESDDKTWKANLRKISKAGRLKPRLPSGLQGSLRPYQKEGFRWLTRSAEWAGGVCLADDMGLGKTVQLLAFLLSRASDGPALVVAPTSVCRNWVEEAARFAPELSTSLLAESDREQLLARVKGGDLVVCSYGLLSTSGELLKKVSWHTLILDEAQAIKNPQTQRFKAAVSLQSNFRVAATGTPVENHLGELWALFRFLNPGYLGPQKSFLSRHGQDRQSLENLRDLVRPFILRRLKTEVLQDLPPKTDITLKVELSEEERIFYESLRLRAVERLEQEQAGLIGVLAELTRLRRACCHPSLIESESVLPSAKMKRFLRLVTDLKESGHRVLVFSQFVDHLSLVRKELEKLDFTYQYLDGSTPATKRHQAVQAFQAGEGDVFLISLKAGGTGLNLTAADYVVHLDPWWNPAAEDQASDRAHRIGQQKPVTIYRLITQDTIEEQILELHSEKRELVDTLLEGTEKTGKLSAEELLKLLRGARNELSKQE